MTIRKTYVATFEVQSGMRLAKDLCEVRNHRMFKLPAGTELTEEILGQMRAWEVTCVQVEEDDNRTPEHIQADRRRIEELTHQIFSGVDATVPALNRLYQITLDYRLEHA